MGFVTEPKGIPQGNTTENLWQKGISLLYTSKVSTIIFQGISFTICGII